MPFFTAFLRKKVNTKCQTVLVTPVSKGVEKVREVDDDNYDGTENHMWDFQNHVIDDANDKGNVDNICIGCCCDVDFVDVQ